MIRYSDISLRNKLIAVFGLSLIFIGGIIVTGLLSMMRMRDASKASYEEAIIEAQRLFKLEKDLEKNRRALLAMIVEPDRGRLTEHVRTIEAATKDMEDNFKAILDHKTHSEDKIAASLADMRSSWNEFRETRDKQIIPALLEGRRAGAVTLATGVQEMRFKKFIGVSEALVARKNEEARATQRHIDRLFSNSRMFFSLISFGGFLVATAALYYLSRDLNKRLKTITDAFARVRNGELDFKMQVCGRDELGAAAVDLNNMIRQLYEDRIMQQQAEFILKWHADESAKKVEELERLNSIIAATEKELSIKNSKLEESIGELKRANQKLVETRDQMIQSEKMATIGQLAAGVAHEINNPLAYINSNINCLKTIMDDLMEIVKIDTDLHRALFEGTLADCPGVFKRLEEFRKTVNFTELIEDINNINRESKEGIERIINIVRGLKDFAHTNRIEKQACDINKCIDDTIKLCWHEFKYKAEIKREFGDIPPVFCNSQQISQVFMNIIINAAYAIREKGEIRISTYLTGSEVFIEISDTGCGIPSEVIDKIFDPFFTTKPVGKGTGLGLSIAYGLVKEHNGSIDVESKPGEGTVFTVRLPVHQEFT